MKLEIDVREPDKYIEHYRKMFEVEVAEYEVSDYHVSNLIGIERKAEGDFIGSMVNKRLFAQAKELSDNFVIKIVMVEGSIGGLLTPFVRRGVHPNAVIGAIASLVTDYRVNVMFVGKDFFTITDAMFKRIKDNKRDEVLAKYSPIRETPSDENCAINILCGFPNIGYEHAKRIMDKYGTLELAINNMDDWVTLPRMSKNAVKKAKEIFKGEDEIEI